MVFYFFNVAEALDTPGEYFIDDDLMLYYYTNDDFASSTVKLPLTKDTLIGVLGGNVTIENLAVECGRQHGIYVNDVDNVTIKNCKISNFTQSGVCLYGNNNTLEGCEISMTGNTAVNISGGDAKALTESGSVALNNDIHDFGKIKITYSGAFTVSGCGVKLVGNKLYNSDHLAVYYNGPLHLFESNEIHDVCRFADDSGAIYGGRNFTSYGTTMKYNYIHDIGASADEEITYLGSSGIYWDDGLSGQTAYGNIFENITGNAFAIGGGRDNVVHDNLMINTNGSINYDSRMHDVEFRDNASYHSMQPALLEVNYQSGAWAEKFPSLAKVTFEKTDASESDPNYFAAPANASVKNNYFYISEARKDEDEEKYARIYDEVVRFSDFSKAEISFYSAQPTVAEALASLGDKIDAKLPG